MQEQNSNLEKIINMATIEIKQNTLAICENESKQELDFKSATGFVTQVKNILTHIAGFSIKFQKNLLISPLFINNFEELFF